MNSSERDDIPAEVDFSQGKRGKYAGRVKQNVIYIPLEEDVQQVFQTAEQVNSALRMLIKTASAATSGDWQKAS